MLQDSLFLAFSSLTMMCLGKSLFESIILELYWASWMCRVMLCCQIWEVFTITSSKSFLIIFSVNAPKGKSSCGVSAPSQVKQIQSGECFIPGKHQAFRWQFSGNGSLKEFYPFSFHCLLSCCFTSCDYKLLVFKVTTNLKIENGNKAS